MKVGVGEAKTMCGIALASSPSQQQAEQIPPTPATAKPALTAIPDCAKAA